MKEDDKRRLAAAAMHKALDGDLRGAKNIQHIVEAIEEDEENEQPAPEQ